MKIEFKENPHPDHLYTLEEVAIYAGRTPQILRLYYYQGLLPEPRHSIKHKRKTTRKFTLAEARNIKTFFESVGHGSLYRARKHKERQEAHAKISDDQKSETRSDQQPG